MDASAPLPTARWRPWIAAAALVALVAWAHGGALRNGFVSFDDNIYVYENPHVRGGLGREGIAWAFGAGGDRPGYFHPLTWISLMVDAQLFGLRAWGFHLVNVLLHATNALLLFALLWRTTRRLGPALAAASLWAVHPLTVEGVTWVAERKAVLSTAFALAAVLVHASHAGRPARWKQLAVAALVAAGVLAKPATVVVPALLLVVDAWPLGRLREQGWSAPSIGRLVMEKASAFAAAGTLAVLSLAAAAEKVRAAADVPIGVRVWNAFAAVPSYLAAALWPSGLAVLHPYPDAVPWGRVAAGVALVAAGTGGAVLAARRWLPGFAGWSWFLVALGPYLGLKQMGLWPAWAERFAYLPLAGVAIAAAYGAADLARRLGRGGRAAAALAAAAVLALGTVARAQVEVWRDSESLYRGAARSEPRSAMMRSNLGNAILAAGRVEEAKGAFREALAIDPEFPLAHAELGTLLMREGSYAEAERHLLSALRKLPDMPELLYNCGEVLRASGQPERARAYYARFVELAPPRLERERRTALRLLAR